MAQGGGIAGRRLVRRIGHCAAGLAMAAIASGVQAQDEANSLRIATWNVANLHHEVGTSVPGRDVARSAEDYTWLRHYAYKLDADIVALQEINSRAAAHRLFSRGRYEVVISGRRLLDLQAYDLTGEWPDASIYTGFAVKRDIEIVRVEDRREFEISHVDPETGIARPTRWAVELEVEHRGQRLILLGVHLKSGCTRGALRDGVQGYDTFINEEDPDCTTAARQVGPLRKWIEAKRAGAVPFVILGDFNRAFDMDGPADQMWQGLTKGLPGGAGLVRFPNGQDATCWKDAPPAPHYRFPIDHLLFDPRAARWVRPGGFGWLTYERRLAERYDRISDHCPAYVDLSWPERRAGASLAPMGDAQPMAVKVDVGHVLDDGLTPLQPEGNRPF